MFVFQHLIETSQWGDNSADIEQQLISHSKFHSSIQRSPEVDKAKVELVGTLIHTYTPVTNTDTVTFTLSLIHILFLGVCLCVILTECVCVILSVFVCSSLQIKKGDKANQYALDQEWDTLQVTEALGKTHIHTPALLHNTFVVPLYYLFLGLCCTEHVCFHLSAYGSHATMDL